MASHTNKIINAQLSVTKKLLLVPPGYFQTFINMQKRNTARLTRLSSGGHACERRLRAAVCKYREFAVKTEISKFFIFSQKKKKKMVKHFRKSPSKFPKNFPFSRKPAKGEMLPHANSRWPKAFKLYHFQSPRKEKRFKETSSSLAGK